MKKAIHPKTYNVQVKCSCGNSFEIVSTREQVRTEVCYDCHPFYTGKSNVVDMTGQVDKFKKRRAKTTDISKIKKIRKPKRLVKKVQPKMDKKTPKKETKSKKETKK